MSTTARRNSASLLAYLYYWNQHPPPDFCKVWMVLCFPLDALYVRKLTVRECREMVFAGDATKTWYGAFNQFTFALLAVADSLDGLLVSAYQRGYIPMNVH